MRTGATHFPPPDTGQPVTVLRVLVSWWAALGRRGAVVGATAVATLTGLTGLGYQPLAWNEAVTASAAQHDPARLVALLSRTDAPLGLYYALMHGWVSLLS